MRTIYIDSLYHCHTVNDGTMTAVETACFDGMCDAFIEGYCIELNKDGNIDKRYPCKPYSELEDMQREYERQILVDQARQIEDYEKNLAELDAMVLDYQYNILMEDL